MKNNIPPERSAIEDVVSANHILYAQRVLDAFGHVSARSDSDPGRFWLARNMAPALVGFDDIMEFDLDANAVDARGRGVYLERFIHSAIYRSRPDVKSIVHSHSPAVIPFGVTKVPLRPVFHMSAFLGSQVGVFEIRDVAGATNMLIGNPELGEAFAKFVADKPAVLMRGHGAVVVGNSVPQAVYRAVYLELNARVQSDAIKLGAVNFLTAKEAKLASEANDSQVLRPWALWKHELAEKGKPLK